MYQASEIADHLVHLVATSADRRVPGVILGSALRLKYPHFQPLDYDVPNLKKFVERYASATLEIVGRSGLDVVYALHDIRGVGQTGEIGDSKTPTVTLISETPKEPTPDLDECLTASPPSARVEPLAGGDKYPPVWFPKDVWIAFSSVAKGKCVVANRETGEIIVDYAEESARSVIDSSLAIIPSLGRQDHIEMARDFEATLSPELRAEVGHLIGGPGKWWSSFQLRLAAASPKEADRWKAFHNARTQRKLLTALETAGVPIEKVAGRLRQNTQSDGFPARQKDIGGRHEAFPKGRTVEPEFALRSLATVLTCIGELINELSGKRV